MRYFAKKLPRAEKFVPNLSSSPQEDYQAENHARGLPSHKRFRAADGNKRLQLNQLEERPSPSTKLKAPVGSLFGTSDYETDIGAFYDQPEAEESKRFDRKSDKRNLDYHTAY